MNTRDQLGVCGGTLLYECCLQVKHLLVSSLLLMSLPRMALDGGAEIPQILHALDQGTVMIRFFRRKSNKPEKRIFCLRTDTFEILQFPMARGRHTLSEESSRWCARHEYMHSHLSSFSVCTVADSGQHLLWNIPCL